MSYDADVTGCYIKQRAGDTDFCLNAPGLRMHGYAIIPIEEWQDKEAAVAAKRERSNKSVSFFINAWLSLLLDYLRERPAMLEALKPELQELIAVLDTAAGIRRGHE